MAHGEWVTITHPDDPAKKTARVTRDAFNEHWALDKVTDEGVEVKGWVEVDAVAAKATEVLGKPVDSISKLKKEELAALASRAGVVVDESASKSDVEAAITEALSEEA